MKRKFLLFVSLVTILCISLAFSVMAEDNLPTVTDTYYLVNSEESDAYSSLTAQGANVVCYKDIIGDTTGTQKSVFFGDFDENAHVELIFAEDIFVSQEMAANNTGILINTPITLTVNYNGFCHYISSSADCSNNGIVIRHHSSTLRLIGTKAVDLDDGSVSQEFNAPSYDSETDTWNVEGANLDVYKTNNHYIQLYSGNFYVEGVRAQSSKAIILTDSSAKGVYEIKSCAVAATNNYAVQLKSTESKTVKVENSYIQGLEGWSVLSGSYVKNSTITGVGVVIDSWHNPGKVWEFIGCDILGEKIQTSTGRTYLWFIDCNIREGIKWNLNGDNGGNQYVRIYTSATCEEPGSFIMKQSTNKGSSNPYADEVANYSAPALGHTGTAEWAYNYAGDKYLSDLTVTKGCTRCGLWEPESIFVGTMFEARGYSVPEFGDKLYITAGFTINKEAIQKYEEISGSKLNFGCAIAVKDLLGENNSPLNEKGDAVTLESGNVLCADITSSVNSYMDVMVNLTDAHLDTLLLITGYITEKSGDSLTVSYMQSGDTLVQNNEFEYVSYNNR